MKKLIILALVLCSALSLTVDVQPNLIRALPGEFFQINVLILPDSSGFYSVKVEGSGLSFDRTYELLSGQSFKVPPISVTAPTESGEYKITATVSFGESLVESSAKVIVIEGAGESWRVNATLYQLRYELDELIVRAQGVEDASSKLTEAEQLLNQANSSYQIGYIISAQSSLDEAQLKMDQARTILNIAEKSKFNINIGLLLVGVLVILTAYVLMKYLK